MSSEADLRASDQAEEEEEEEWETEFGLAHEHPPLACPTFAGDAQGPTAEEGEGGLLVVLAHGFLGTKADFRALAALVQARHPRARVLVSSRNSALSSNAGIAAGGRVLAREIADSLLAHHFSAADPRTFAQELRKQPLLQLESIRASLEGRAGGAPPLRLLCVGHSLGGLYLRHALGLLQETGFLSGPRRLLAPLSYVSVASPHLGSRRPRTGVKGRLIQATLDAATLVGSRSIRDLLMADGRPPLLVTMAEPGSCFMAALAAFRSRTAVSSTHYDQIVPFASAAIMAENPFPPVRHSSRFLVMASSGFSAAHEGVIATYACQAHHRCPRDSAVSLFSDYRQESAATDETAEAVELTNVTAWDKGREEREETEERKEKERTESEEKMERENREEREEREREERRREEREERETEEREDTEYRDEEREESAKRENREEEGATEEEREDSDSSEAVAAAEEEMERLQASAALDGLMEDADGNLEYSQAVMDHLNELPWRRLHCQFSSASRMQRWMAHEAPLAKKKNPLLAQVLHLDTDAGKDFLSLLVALLDLDIEAA